MAKIFKNQKIPNVDKDVNQSKLLNTGYRSIISEYNLFGNFAQWYALKLNIRIVYDPYFTHRYTRDRYAYICSPKEHS